MSLEIKLQMKMQQKLVMSQNLQQAIKLLQLTRIELKEVLEEKLLENPILEVASEATPEETPTATTEDRALSQQYEESRTATTDIKEVFPDKVEDTKPTEQTRWEEIDEYLREEYDYGYTPRESKEVVILENLAPETISLFDILYEQLLLTNFDQQQEKIGLAIIGNVDENGYLLNPLEEIASEEGVAVPEVEEVLRKIQTYEPPGIAARDLRECMLIQIDQLFPDEFSARAIIENHLEELERNDFAKISECLSISLEEVHRAIEVILGLEPKPGRKYSTEKARYIIPDVVISKVDDEFVVLVNDDGIPRLRISNLYLKILKGKKEFADDTRDYIEKKLNAARWLIRSIEQRQQTLYKVCTSLLKFQKDFFEKGIGYLKPLVLRDVAEDIGMHELTVSRVSTNKYMHTPRGVFELKYFFHSGLSSTFGEDVSSIRIKETIKKLVNSENPNRPFSDKNIADLLYQQGIKIARRTVAKYREELKILPSNKRKRM